MVEYKYEDWVADDNEAAEAAKEREEDAMFKPKFANVNARRQELTEAELSQLFEEKCNVGQVCIH